MIEIRYAASDDDIIVIHRFLMVVAGPTLPGPINPQKSIEEVWRTVTDDVALMAIQDGALIGTIGLVRPTFWWGDVAYLASRWFFTLPGTRAAKPLLREAKAIAVASELELHIISEERGTVTILNKSKRRNSTSTHHVLRLPTAVDRDQDHDPARVAY